MIIDDDIPSSDFLYNFLGLLQITIAQKVVNNEHKDDSTTKDAELPETESSVINPFATPEELERGKLPPEEILSLPMFKVLIPNFGYILVT